MNTKVDCSYEILQAQNCGSSGDSIHKIDNGRNSTSYGWSLISNETPSNKCFMEANVQLNEMINANNFDNSIHKTWSTPYLNNNEDEYKDLNENECEHYLNLLEISKPWSINASNPPNTPSSSSYSSNSNSLLRDAINNNIEKSWLTSLKRLSKIQVKSNNHETYKTHDNEISMVRSQSGSTCHLGEENYAFQNTNIMEGESKERTSNKTCQPTFLLSTNLESLSPITVSLNDLALGGNEVSALFPSNKIVYLDSPIRITILGSKQVGKSALAVRYLSRQDPSYQVIDAAVHEYCQSSSIQGI